MYLHTSIYCLVKSHMHAEIAACKIPVVLMNNIINRPYFSAVQFLNICSFSTFAFYLVHSTLRISQVLVAKPLKYTRWCYLNKILFSRTFTNEDGEIRRVPGSAVDGCCCQLVVVEGCDAVPADETVLELEFSPRKSPKCIKMAPLTKQTTSY